MSEPARKRRPYAARVPMAERREQLLDAALTVIDRDGYDGVSIDAIAKEAGVTRPVVYGAFDGLGPLLSALLDRQQQRAIAQLYAALPLTALASTPRRIVERAVPALHAMVLADPLTWRAILQSPANVPDVVRDRIESDRARVRGTIETMLAAVLPAGTDVEVLAHAILAVLDHFGQLVLAEPERFTAERLTAAARAMIGAWLP
ncbi:TetR/AcrR family transcriptional regulator [Nocardioides albidus]|uniref:TetR/AcrR family transcriptional regulator n=1 Tax=Nocardioides albidus TaxID=1517589 RepID=A0A5C4VSM3_9ACTN|nr:TetR/AcrR family transcriptional regulator [Nocardioides albidus]TNM38329.1 TetR/AcrR family transcriptional regulator [Nocardioides albidus]